MRGCRAGNPCRASGPPRQDEVLGGASFAYGERRCRAAGRACDHHVNPARNACSWGPAETPPNTDAPVSGVWTASALTLEDLCGKLARRCKDRARVRPRGLSTSACRIGAERRRLAAARLRAGEHVTPAIAGGMASAWTGVGRAKPSSRMLVIKLGCNFKLLNGKGLSSRTRQDHRGPLAGS